MGPISIAGRVRAVQRRMAPSGSSWLRPSPVYQGGTTAHGPEAHSPTTYPCPCSMPPLPSLWPPLRGLLSAGFATPVLEVSPPLPCWQRAGFYSQAPRMAVVTVEELKLAQTGEGIAECELLQWFVQEGEEVKPFQLVCQVQSDKATVDITSRFHGQVVRTHFVPGDIVKVGETLLDILTLVDERPGTGPEAEPRLLSLAGGSRPMEGEELQQEHSATPAGAGAEQTAAGPPVNAGKGVEGDTLLAGAPSSSTHVLATPAVRNLARLYSLNLSAVQGTGPQGRVLKEDVVRHVAMRQAVEEDARVGEEALEGPSSLPGATVQTDLLRQPQDWAQAPAGPPLASGLGDLGSTMDMEARMDAVEEVMRPAAYRASSVAPSSPSGVGIAPAPGANAVAEPAVLKDTDILIRGYRRAMAKSMASAATVPHFNLMDEFDVTKALEFVSRFNGRANSSGSVERLSSQKLTSLPLLVKALSLALLKFPEVNATVDKEVTVIKCAGSHNIGIAMATKHGLVVPNIKDCQRRTVLEIAAELHRLRQLALANQLPPHDLAGGTITVSNIGAVGAGTYACPLIFQPQLAIVALGRARKLPRFDSSGHVVECAIMNVSWAADHRVVDGATLAGLSKEWQRLVEDPEQMLVALR